MSVIEQVRTELSSNRGGGLRSLATAIDIVKIGTTAIFMPIFLKNSFGTTLHDIENPNGADTRDVFLVLPSNKEESKEEKVLAKALRQIL